MSMLTRLWPGEGFRCIARYIRDESIPVHKRMRQSWHETTDAAMDAARRYDAAGLDVYFCPSLFSEKSRTQRAAVSTNAIYIDLDAGPGKPHATYKAALGALLAWCKAQSFPPPPVLVKSGYGLHCYWMLTESLTIARWEVLAKRFKQVCLATGLEIDTSCTGDAARLMRVPGTHNYKREAPAPVEVLMERDERIAPDDFSALMPAVGPRALAAPGPRPKVDAQWSTDTEFPPADAEQIALKCGQMAHFKEVRGAVEEPLWRAGLSILHRCEDGETLIHEWSKGDERYSPTETRAKAQGTAGPATCAFFAEQAPERCEGCPHQGEIKSPITLGTPTLPAVSGATDLTVNPADGKWTDERLASVFTENFGDRLRYVSAWGCWMLWDRKCWRKDETLAARNMAREICRRVAAAIAKSDRSLGSERTIAAIERLARADRQHAATAEQWDADQRVINTPGGLLELNEQPALLEHDPERYQTKIAAVPPDMEMPTPLWNAFLDRVTGSDKQLQGYMQRAAGYCLTGETAEHVLFFNYGTGANGKTVFVETLAGILHDYHVTAPVDVFMANKNDRHPTELAMMKGARLVTATETAEGRRWDDAKVKQLTGGDSIAARYMRQDYFEFKPQFKLMISGNHRPGLRSVDEAIRRRIHLIPFTVTVPPAERDLKLAEKLRVEWPGILGWMIKGCAEWRRIGLAPPECVTAATNEYLTDEDSFGQWLGDAVDTVQDGFAATSALYDSWKEHCDKTGERHGSMKQLNQRLRDRGFEPSRTARNRGFMGLRLLETVGGLGGGS